MANSDHAVTFRDTSSLPVWDSEGRKFIGGINTWDDWHLIPASRPEITVPEVYTNYVDLPAAFGKINLSTYLTGGKPVFKNRSGGSLTFYAANNYGKWNERRQTILNYLHGKLMYIGLVDEPEYYYKGRIKISRPFDSDGKSNWSSVTIEYELDPYKYPINGGGGNIL